jgi:hypothetical protein
MYLTSVLYIPDDGHVVCRNMQEVTMGINQFRYTYVLLLVLLYRVRHKSVNTPSLSHERLVIIFGQYFIHGTLTGERYRVML